MTAMDVSNNAYDLICPEISTKPGDFRVLNNFCLQLSDFI
jgi:hypothetical protein